ncbi:MAG: amidohydrolase family protein, partial [Gemmatimonadales bacterium]
CGINPLKDYALDELARCARTPGLDRGIKLHLGNSDVQLENPEHIDRLRQVFQAANQHHMTIVVHMRASISRKRPYGPMQARAFLEQLLPQAPDIPVQVAHLAGTGPGYDDPPADSVMAFLADAVHRKDPRTRHLWFDLAGIMDSSVTPAQAARMVQRIRRAGVDRILYGSDAAVLKAMQPREEWAAFRRLPLTPAEFENIARNIAPYLQ